MHTATVRRSKEYRRFTPPKAGAGLLLVALLMSGCGEGDEASRSGSGGQSGATGAAGPMGQAGQGGSSGSGGANPTATGGTSGTGGTTPRDASAGGSSVGSGGSGGTSGTGGSAGAGMAGMGAAMDARPADTAPANRDMSPVAAGASPITGAGALELVMGGYQKLDTPCWLSKEGVLVFTDLDAGKQYKLTPPKTIEPLRDGARCTVSADGTMYFGGMAGLQRAAGVGAPEILVDKAPDGIAIGPNDLAISKKGLLYFSNLKAPDPPGKGSLNVLDVAARKVSVVFDGRMEMGLWNPNGVALSPDEKFLYVGISSYDNRSTSAVYRFPIKDDGALDVAAGKAAKWAAVSAPDGIAVDQQGNVYFTAGGVIEVWSAEGKRWGTLKVPKGSATNLGFGGADLRTLYVTTNPELYQVKVGVPGLP